MEIKVRNIGNSIGLILPKAVSSRMDFHVGDVVTVEVHSDIMNIHKKSEDLKNRILRGIKASEKENLKFVESFASMKSEQW